jgi:hypothetical protein
MRRALCHITFLAVALSCTFSIALPAQVNVTTYHFDNARTGQNTQETILTPASVNSGQFGKLFSVSVDGWVYAQPLYLSNVNIGGGTHNVLYVATEHDSLYAIDADKGTIFWQISFIPSGGSAVNSSSDLGGCGDLIPEIGITGTPVIDTGTGTIYLVAKSKVNGMLVQYLHAIDVVTSTEKFGGPVSIQASVAGTASDGNGATVTFSPSPENQRAGLLLKNGHVLIAWGSHCDGAPWHGWIMSYSASTLAQEAAFNTSADGFGNGVWMAGGGLAADSNGNIFFATGNGSWNGTTDYGDSIVKLGPPSGGSFPVLDYFTPYNQNSLAGGDSDVASGGLVLLPNLPSGQQLLTQMGKEGKMYVLDRNNMGKYCVNQTPPCNGSDPNIVQEIPAATTGLYGTPAYWNGSVYWGGGSDYNGPDNLKAFSFNANNSGLISTSPTSQSAKAFSFPGPSPSISANGNTNGILWGLDNSAFGSTCSGGSNCQVLYAYDATNLANMLYNSSQAANNRDVPGGAVKFATPIIANGKVYVGSQFTVSAYGIQTAAPVITSPTTASGTVGSAFSYQITASNVPTSYGATGLPAGLSVNSGTGLISGTPTTAATSTVTLSATNGGGTGTATLTLNINPTASWYNTAWGYRNAITVANASGAALTSFQINVRLTVGFPFSRANANGSDLRFTASDGITLIPFWVETWNPGQNSASLWVNVPSIPTAGTTIYVYYGNSSATSVSSGTSTFNFFDDFSESSVDSTRWTPSGGTWSIVTDTQQDGTTGGVLSGSTTTRQILASSYSGTDYVLQAYGKQVSGRVWGVGTRVNTVSNLYSANLYDDLNSTNNVYLYSWVNNGSTTLGNAAVGTVNANIWYQLMVKAHSNHIDVYKDGVLEVQGTDSNLASGGIALYGENNTVAEFNNVFVRQYASVEPTLTIGGSTTQGGTTLSSVTLSPMTVLGGVSSQGTVTLGSAAPTGGAVVTLSSSNSTVAPVPASITIPAGRTTGTFSVPTTGVSATTNVTISASYGGNTQATTLTINPLLTSVFVNPTSVVAGVTSVGTVSLAAAAPAGGISVTLSSNNAAVASVPTSVTIAAGSSNVTFTVTTSAVSSSTVVTLSASYSGGVQTTILTVTPALSSITLNPTSVTGGTSSQGTITLAGNAPTGGAVVTLSSSNSTVAAVPVSVTIPAGSSSAIFTINTTGVSSTTVATITASYGNASPTTSLTVQAGSSTASWYNTAWGYRNAITVANASGAALTSFQINVRLTVGFPFSRANANGSDLRFTASDGITLIPFWVETWNPGQNSASLWVNVPSIPTAGTTIYVYYGNSSATSVSSGTSTFNFFDDFSESSVDSTRWTPSGGTWSIVTDTQQDGTTGGVLSGSTTTRQILASSYSGTDYVLQAYGKQVSGRVWGVGTRVNTVSNLYSANLYDDLNSTNNVYLYSWVNNGSTTLGNAAVGTVNANIWYQLMVKAHSNHIDVYKDGVLEVQGTDSNLASGGIALYGENNTVAEFNNVFVRQYASVEPTLTIGGSTTQGGTTLSSVTLSPMTVLGGVSSQGTVTLGSAAPTGGAVVTLSSSNSTVAPVPASITIPAGRTTGTFSVPTTGVFSYQITVTKHAHQLRGDGRRNRIGPS